MRPLALVASAEAVPALAALLADEKLGHYARDVLEQMAHVDADTALLSALPRLTGDAQLGVINSLGLRRTARAVDSLNALAFSDDAPTTAPALLALGRIATPSALATLQPALTRKSPAVRAAAAEAPPSRSSSHGGVLLLLFQRETVSLRSRVLLFLLDSGEL
mgnify:CR=1 FL=1